jgi:DNA modification methylase
LIQILQGDCRQVLSTLPAESVQTCVTSPPYFGLRDYGMDGQIGLEQTPDAYVAEMVAVFREVRRVLKDDGTLWLNIGDSYNAYNGNRGRGPNLNKNNHDALPSLPSGTGLAVKSLGNKQLIGIPWRVAFALQADGWYLRQDIIWHKPNPMPESVRDRCTKAHEYIFLLAKAERYHFHSAAMKEPAVYAGQMRGGSKNRYEQNSAGMDCKVYDTRNKRSVWSVQPKPYKGAHFATYPPALIEPCILAGSRPGDTVLDPFNGSGTTGEVATMHGRDYIGVELNPEYVALTHKRLSGVQMQIVNGPSLTVGVDRV